MKAFIIARDRVSYTRRCMAAMLAAGLEVVIVDNGSTWPAMTCWLEHLDATGADVLRRGGGHPRELWGWLPFRALAGDQRYVVTDPDVVPAAGCPLDWPRYLGELLDRYPGYLKAGLGLRTDNLPAHYARREQVIGWESQFRAAPLDGEPGAFAAAIDTTLAMYQPLSTHPVFAIDGAIRAGPPYVADHLAWHEDLSRPSAEIQYYYEHAEPGISHWAASGHSNWGN